MPQSEFVRRLVRSLAPSARSHTEREIFVRSVREKIKGGREKNARTRRGTLVKLLPRPRRTFAEKRAHFRRGWTSLEKSVWRGGESTSSKVDRRRRRTFPSKIITARLDGGLEEGGVSSSRTMQYHSTARCDTGLLIYPCALFSFQINASTC